MTKLESQKIARQLIRAERALDDISSALKGNNPYVVQGLIQNIMDQYKYYDWDAETEEKSENDRV
jgi:hypothetical protein